MNDDIILMIKEYGILKYRAGCSRAISGIELINQADAILNNIAICIAQYEQEKKILINTSLYVKNLHI